MPARHAAIFNPRRSKQRGAALMIMIVVLVTGAASALIGALSTTALKNARQETTSNALAQAKDALIGKSIAYDDYPGSLPCPDTDNDGISDAGGSSECPSYVGRLPWYTLGLPDLRDAAGERLWYSVSRNFRRYDSVRPLNSNTKGTLLIYSTDGVTQQTQAGYDAVAVIFSPGSVLGSQARSTTAEQNSAANYLDIANGRNNASASGPFISGNHSDTFNDQLLFITTKDLMPLVEQRVAAEVKRSLANYYTNSGCSCYPWADSVSASSDYDSNYGLNRGWLPNNALPVDWSGTFRPPSWFFDNEWYKLIYYSVAKNYSADPSYCYYYGSCSGSSTLSVGGVSGVRALFFMPGTPIGTLTRSLTNLTHYLEDSENYDDNDDNYVTPASQAGDRDRLYRLP